MSFHQTLIFLFPSPYFHAALSFPNTHLFPCLRFLPVNPQWLWASDPGGDSEKMREALHFKEESSAKIERAITKQKTTPKPKTARTKNQAVKNGSQTEYKALMLGCCKERKEIILMGQLHLQHGVPCFAWQWEATSRTLG